MHCNDNSKTALEQFEHLIAEHNQRDRVERPGVISTDWSFPTQEALDDYILVFLIYFNINDK